MTIDSMWLSDDVEWMEEALQQARRASEKGEVPVGAVLVRGGEVLARAHNLVVTRHDPTAHAELLALHEGAQRLENERLIGATLYTTLEPCAMCAGAMILARIDRVVFGAWDPKAGALGSTLNLTAYGNHRLHVAGGMLAEASQALLQGFFQTRRSKSSKNFIPL